MFAQTRAALISTARRLFGAERFAEVGADMDLVLRRLTLALTAPP